MPSLLDGSLAAKKNCRMHYDLQVASTFILLSTGSVTSRAAMRKVIPLILMATVVNPV
jgi:hypothetical protein